MENTAPVTERRQESPAAARGSGGEAVKASPGGSPDVDGAALTPCPSRATPSLLRQVTASVYYYFIISFFLVAHYRISFFFCFVIYTINDDMKNKIV